VLINKEKELYMHSIQVTPDREGLPKLVMIHGFGGAGAFYCRMLSYLRNYFHCYTVDLLGLGCSSRPEFTQFDVKSANAFFVDSIRAFMVETGLDKEEIYLLGHSLGGYISGQYVEKYPEKIIKLVLMSPVGIPERPKALSKEVVLGKTKSCVTKYGI
jgi:pimeloyl-ACP methyl ester carboxylesterase